MDDMSLLNLKELMTVESKEITWRDVDKKI